jgi:hypothetical protein
LGKISFCEPVDFGIATFGNKSLPNSIGLRKFASENNYAFYDDDRQNVPCGSEFHCCEILGLLSVSKHFYDLGYKKVFILHNDMFVFKDFIGVYSKNMCGNWSFILPFIDIDKGAGLKTDYERILSTNSYDIKKTPYRLTQTIVLLNKSFVNDVYKTYTNNDSLWKSVFSKISMYGDVGLFGIASDFLGYKASPIFGRVESSLRWDSEDVVLKEIEDKNIYYIHGEDTCNLAERYGYV